MTKKSDDLVSFPMRLSQEVERLFDEMIHRPWGFCREIRGWNPSVDLYETPEAFILEADLPGVNLEDVTVEMEDDVLVTTGLANTRERSRQRQIPRYGALLGSVCSTHKTFPVG